MLSKEIIRSVIDYQQDLYSKQDPGTSREILKEFRIHDTFVSVITGVRRAGKSTFLRQYLKENFEQYLLLNLEDPKLTGFEFGDFLRLDEITREKPNQAIAFDEIQAIQNWETYIRSRQEEPGYVIVTGSNASLLSREFGTRLTGRYLPTEIFPFSYGEYLSMFSSLPSASTLSGYMDLGGFPEFLKIRDEEILYRLMDDIIYRDIAVRYNIKNHKILRQVAVWMISNSGNTYTLNRLNRLFGKGSVRSIADYVSYLEDSYLIMSVPLFSSSVNKQLVNPRKVYCVDTGLSRVNSLSLSKDYDRRFENLIFLHLRRSHRSIFYYSGKFECDFVVMKGAAPVCAVQVCYELTMDNLERELDGIIAAMKDSGAEQGTIVTFNQEELFEKDGFRIKTVPGWKYLLGEN
jgi:uncharacterized protein